MYTSIVKLEATGWARVALTDWIGGGTVSNATLLLLRGLDRALDLLE